MNYITLGAENPADDKARPAYDPPTDLNRVTNVFEMHTGASRYGVGRFLMPAPDYKGLMADYPDGVVWLNMGCDSNAGGSPGDAPLMKSPGVKFKVMIAAAQTLSLAVRGTNDKPSDLGLDPGDNADMLEVTVFDLRCTLYAPKTLAVNVNTSDFAGFFASTLHSGSEWTWADAVAHLEIDGLAWPSLPTTWKPRNLIFDGVPKARIPDDVAARLFYVIGYDPTTPGVAKYSYIGLKAYAPGTLSYANSTQLLAAQAAGCLIGGGTTQTRNPTRLPGTLDVTFKAMDADFPADPFKHRTYVKSISPVGAGDVSYRQALAVGEYIGLYASSAWTNQSEMDAVATDLAPRAGAFLAVLPNERKYAGIWPIFPDGAVRGVRWGSDNDGAYTLVRYNNDLDFDVMPERPNELISNQLVLGLAGTNTSVSASGARMVWVPPPATPLKPCCPDITNTCCPIVSFDVYQGGTIKTYVFTLSGTSTYTSVGAAVGSLNAVGTPAGAAWLFTADDGATWTAYGPCPPASNISFWIPNYAGDYMLAVRCTTPYTGGGGGTYNDGGAPCTCSGLLTSYVLNVTANSNSSIILGGSPLSGVAQAVTVQAITSDNSHFSGMTCSFGTWPIPTYYFNTYPVVGIPMELVHFNTNNQPSYTPCAWVIFLGIGAPVAPTYDFTKAWIKWGGTTPAGTYNPYNDALNPAGYTGYPAATVSLNTGIVII